MLATVLYWTTLIILASRMKVSWQCAATAANNPPNPPTTSARDVQERSTESATVATTATTAVACGTCQNLPVRRTDNNSRAVTQTAGTGSNSCPTVTVMCDGNSAFSSDVIFRVKGPQHKCGDHRSSRSIFEKAAKLETALARGTRNNQRRVCELKETVMKCVDCIKDLKEKYVDLLAKMKVGESKGSSGDRQVKLKDVGTETGAVETEISNGAAEVIGQGISGVNLPVYCGTDEVEFKGWLERFENLLMADFPKVSEEQKMAILMSNLSGLAYSSVKAGGKKEDSHAGCTDHLRAAFRIGTLQKLKAEKEFDELYQMPNESIYDFSVKVMELVQRANPSDYETETQKKILHVLKRRLQKNLLLQLSIEEEIWAMKDLSIFNRRAQQIENYIKIYSPTVLPNPSEKIDYEKMSEAVTLSMQALNVAKKKSYGGECDDHRTERFSEFDRNRNDCVDRRRVSFVEGDRQTGGILKRETAMVTRCMVVILTCSKEIVMDRLGVMKVDRLGCMGIDRQDRMVCVGDPSEEILVVASIRTVVLLQM
uniref:Paraneoplastic antigen Ma-like C-terminal domain-containing protein n=1 Tax=Ditylenchus dipsaci TaxID=166011 RepID=A0A915CLY8_9BILA